MLVCGVDQHTKTTAELVMNYRDVAETSQSHQASTGMDNRHLQFDAGIYILVAAIWEDNDDEGG